jgi:hypothetical protein
MYETIKENEGKKRKRKLNKILDLCRNLKRRSAMELGK